MTEEELLHIAFSLCFLVFLFERGYFQSKAMRTSNELAKYKGKKFTLLGLVIIFIIAQLWVLGTFIFIFNPNFLDWSALALPLWIKWIGLVITILGMGVEFSTQLYLGRNYSTLLNIREEHSLITTGPYRYVRHPMYSALITVGVGLSFLSANWYFALPFIVTIIIIVLRIKKEEELMIDEFREEYIQYMKRTKRFIPFLF
ncbi:MAG: isoprenylcysteine carboxylmethyltransferase family protein [Candidatus Thorarchaeota archaeon]